MRFYFDIPLAVTISVQVYIFYTEPTHKIVK